MPRPAKVYQFERLHQLLSFHEQQEFSAWLATRLQGRQAAMKQLFDLWKVGHPWPVIQQKLSLQQAGKANRLNRLRAELQEHLERFLVEKNLNRSPHLQDTLLADELVHRKGRSIFYPILNKINRRLDEQSVPDAAYFRTQFQRKEIEQGYLVKFLPPTRKKENLTSERLTLWLQATRIEGIELLLPLLLTDTEQARNFVGVLDQLAGLLGKEAEPSPPHFPPAWHLGRQLVDLYLKQDWAEQARTAAEEKAVSLLKQEADALPPSLYTNLNLMLFNYFQRKIRHDPNQRQVGILLDLYESNQLSEQPWPISRQVYRTINQLLMLVAAQTESEVERQQVLERAKEFLRQNRFDLPEEEQENAFAFNLAQVNFVERKFEEVFVIRYKDDLSDPYYQMGHEILLLQARYELGEREDLLEVIHAISQRVKDHPRLRPRQITSSLNRLKLFRKLIQLKNRGSLESLLSELKETRPISILGRVWLAQKIQEWK